MKEQKSLLPDSALTLSRRDLILYEHLLQEEIASYLPFSSYSLFFPRTLDGGGAWAKLREGRAVYIPEEQKVFLPLVLHGKMLGVFAARGVVLEVTETMPAYLASMAAMSMEKLLLYKARITDQLTLLFNETHFLRAVSKEISLVRDCLIPGSGKCLKSGMPDLTPGFGIIHIRMPNIPDWQDRYGYAFTDRALTSAATQLKTLIPEDATAARCGGDTLGVVWPGATEEDCRDLAEHIARGLETVSVPDIMLGLEMALDASIGLAHYPTDMSAHALQQPVREQAGALIDKSTRAAEYAATGCAFSFSQIVLEGGKITTILPLNRLTVSLGRTVGAKEGQRFLVWSSDHAGPDSTPMYKGEIVLMEVRMHSAVADVLYLADASWTISTGDRLTLAPQSEITPTTPRKNGPQQDLLTGLFLYKDFLDHFAQIRDAHESFAMVLLRLPDAIDGDTAALTEMHLREVSATCARLFGDDAIGGRLSIGTLIWFIPNVTANEAEALCETVHAALAASITMPPSIGIAPFPYLTFSRADSMDNVRKALDYAQLLPEPHIGILDSVALNISADHFFSQGRIYDAIEEYKLSLLADATNTLARNSLGICLARTGELSKAKKQFEIVLENDPENLFAQYNYGFACHKMKQVQKAKDAYNKCLAIDDAHVFSLIRLGELAQIEGNFDDARALYTRAATIGGGEKLTHRFLARLALAQNNTDEAREHLHQALIHDPKDAVSLHLMAKLYLDNGEDPQIAEVLARQSAALAPKQTAFWNELARALTAQGKTEEAHTALARAETAMSAHG